MRVTTEITVITNGLRFRIGMSLVVGLTTASAALGYGQLFTGAEYAAGDDPHSVAIGELDRDHVPDLAVANRFFGRM